MRMWMVDPELMCDQHLLGEHVELHMFVGAITKGTSVRGYLEGGLLEPGAIWERHDRLVQEMDGRGMRHRSPLPGCNVDHLPDRRVDAVTSLADLVGRCPACRERGGQSDGGRRVDPSGQEP